jgi:hypothetical protein
MAKVLTLQQAVKTWVLFLLGAAYSAIALHESEVLLRGTPSVSVRWIGVVLGTTGFIPLLGIVLWGVSVADEYQRRIALVGSAIAFVGNFFLYAAFSLMVDAHLVAGNRFIPFLPATIGLLWIVGMLLASVYYRMRP